MAKVNVISFAKQRASGSGHSSAVWAPTDANSTALPDEIERAGKGRRSADRFDHDIGALAVRQFPKEVASGHGVGGQRSIGARKVPSQRARLNHDDRGGARSLRREAR